MRLTVEPASSRRDARAAGLAPARHDDEVGTANDFDVIGTLNGSGGGELNAVGHVEGLGLDLRLINVLKDDRTSVTAHRTRVSDGRTNGTGTDDGNLRRTSRGL